MALRATQKQVKVYQMRLDGEPPDLVETKRRKLEAAYQALVIDWRRQYVGRYPILGRLYATLNGVDIPPKLRKYFVEMGMVKGVFDLCFPQKRVDADGTVWSGCVIDVKAEGGYPTTEQKEWAAWYVANGWRAYFCTGAVETWRTLCSFAGITGADHYAADLARQEETVRKLAGY
jgi:hypothetical protein